MILRDTFISKFPNTVILGKGMKNGIFAEKMETVTSVSGECMSIFEVNIFPIFIYHGWGFIKF
jgi:hypothetical protein